MLPDFTSSRNCEYSIGACAVWRVLNWLNTVISTRPITSQMTRFLSMLFKDLLLYGAAPQENQFTPFCIDCGASRGFNGLSSPAPTYSSAAIPLEKRRAFSPRP